LTDQQTLNQIHEFIIVTVNKNTPKTTNELVDLIQQKYPLSEKEILKILTKLKDENEIHFTKITKQPATSSHLFSRKSLWFWLSIAIAIATVAAVFVVPENAYPLTYARQLLGSIFVLFLPGFVFLKALYPSNVPIATSSENLDAIERAALSLGLSIALTAIVGLILNYTPWGIRLTPITLSLFAFTIIFAAVALFREYTVNNIAL
jgi:uncharacterized membrane protein